MTAVATTYGNPTKSMRMVVSDSTSRAASSRGPDCCRRTASVKFYVELLGGKDGHAESRPLKNRHRQDKRALASGE
jgi:hypothetical protein